MNKSKKITCPDCGWHSFAVVLNFKEKGQNHMVLTCKKCGRNIGFAVGAKK